MDLDWLVFPAPENSYTFEKCNGNIIYVPKKVQTADLSKLSNKQNHIPCIFLGSSSSSVCSKYAIFFHGNAEDINLAFEIINHIRFTLSV